MKPHIHAAVIKVWADGATVQRKIENGEWGTIEFPIWNANGEYRASIAEVEGKPVFIGDEIYAADGHKFIVNEMCSADKWGLNEGCSWNPPKPKTITVTIPRPLNPDGRETKVPIIYINCTEGVLLKYKTKADAGAAMKAIMEAMNEPHP